MARIPSVTFVVMAGGKGERLWPLVRARTPKVCLSPDGTRSLLQATIDRLRPVWRGASWLIVTTQEQADPVRAELPPSMRRALLVEPQIKNTAACITLAALAVGRDPEQVMVVVPADHWVGEPRMFQQAVRTAIRAAMAQDAIAMIGIRPTHPHPGLGYLCGGAPLAGSWNPRVFRLVRFVEKPSRARAQQLLRRPHTYWNSGIFVGTAYRFLVSLAMYLPEHVRRLAPLALTRALRRGTPALTATPAFLRRAASCYRPLKSI